jgi:hypothetical protein
MFLFRDSQEIMHSILNDETRDEITVEALGDDAIQGLVVFGNFLQIFRS